MPIVESRRFDRRIFLGSGLAWFLFGLSRSAQGAVLTHTKLNLRIQRALHEPDTTPLSHPTLLGLGSANLTTKSIESGDKVHKYGFMVIIPRRADGLIFFEGKSVKPIFFAVHRTSERLNRVASVLNKNARLTRWSGREAEENFAKQKAFWADAPM
jgi:hypothetical protein